MSIVKRGGTFGVKIYDPALKRSRWVGTFDTLRLAKRAEADALIDGTEGTMTVAQYADRWLVLHPREKTATNLGYGDAVRPFVRDYGDRRLESFTRVKAIEWALGHRGQHPAVRTMFSDARRDGFVRENVFTGLKLQGSRGRKDLEVLTVTELDNLAAIARATYGPNFAAFILTAAYSGMRPGEMYALTWEHVDWQKQEIRVVHSYSTRARETTSPKNGNQRLTVLFPEAAEALRDLPRDPGPIFRTVTGKPLDGRNLHYLWNPVRVAFGRPKMTTYELRHFYCAHLLNTMGHEAEDVALMVGHTDGGALVRRLYGHPSEKLALQRIKAGAGRKVVPLREVESA